MNIAFCNIAKIKSLFSAFKFLHRFFNWWLCNNLLISPCKIIWKSFDQINWISIYQINWKLISIFSGELSGIWCWPMFKNSFVTSLFSIEIATLAILWYNNTIFTIWIFSIVLQTYVWKHCKDKKALLSMEIATLAIL